MVYSNRITRDASPKESKRLRSITVCLFVQDCTGIFFITDIMLQAGTVGTGWVGHVSEIKFTLDG